MIKTSVENLPRKRRERCANGRCQPIRILKFNGPRVLKFLIRTFHFEPRGHCGRYSKNLVLFFELYCFWVFFSFLFIIINFLMSFLDPLTPPASILIDFQWFSLIPDHFRWFFVFFKKHFLFCVLCFMITRKLCSRIVTTASARKSY